MSNHLVRPTAAVFVLSLAWACGGAVGGQNAAAPTAARTIVGTWKSAAATTINVSTDSGGNSLNTMTLAGTQPWTVTWVITAGSDDNHVNVQMTFAKGAFSAVPPSACLNPILVPEVSPMNLTGVISAGQMRLYYGTVPAGVFNITTDSLTGTFDYTWSGIYRQQEYSATNGMSLTRQ